MENLATLAMAGALAWASGIRLYTLLLILGIAGQQDWIVLPAHLRILQHPFVMTTSGILVVIEFFADKIPGIDSVWDALHTFVRIPAGALLAAGVIGAEDGPAWALVAGLIGGTLTAGTHFTKAGSRALINTSPEPFSNWAASFSEDGLVLGGLWLALFHPAVFLLLLVLFILLMLWLLPKFWRGIKAMIGKLMGLLGGATQPNTS